MTSNIAIVDSNPLVRIGLRKLLKARNYSVIYESETIDTFLKSGMQAQTDILIVEPLFQKQDAISDILLVKQFSDKIKVILFTTSQSYYHVMRSNHLGIEAFICKSWSVSYLFDAITKLEHGEYYYPLQLNDHRNKYPADISILSSLTSREMQVLRFFGAGKTNKDIAEVLNLSSKTISSYKVNMMRKMQTRNIVDLIDLAKRNYLF